MNNLNNFVGLHKDGFPTSSFDIKRPNQLTIYYHEENFASLECTDWKQFSINSLQNSNGYIRKIVFFYYYIMDQYN